MKTRWLNNKSLQHDRNLTILKQLFQTSLLLLPILIIVSLIPLGLLDYNSIEIFEILIKIFIPAYIITYFLLVGFLYLDHSLRLFLFSKYYIKRIGINHKKITIIITNFKKEKEVIIKWNEIKDINQKQISFQKNNVFKSIIFNKLTDKELVIKLRDYYKTFVDKSIM